MVLVVVSAVVLAVVWVWPVVVAVVVPVVMNLFVSSMNIFTVEKQKIVKLFFLHEYIHCLE